MAMEDDIHEISTKVAVMADYFLHFGEFSETSDNQRLGGFLILIDIANELDKMSEYKKTDQEVSDHAGA
jgi:hypothetical protein